MSNEWLICLASGILAGAALLHMMRRRQLMLIGLLKEYVERQVQWNRRKAKAEAIAIAEENRKAAKAAKAAALITGLTEQVESVAVAQNASSQTMQTVN